MTAFYFLTKSTEKTSVMIFCVKGINITKGGILLNNRKATTTGRVELCKAQTLLWSNKSNI